jgi:glucose dehydrogenase
MAIVGTLFLAAAIVLALFVVTDVLFTTDLAIWTAVGAVVVFAGLWYALPMLWRSPTDEEKAAEAREQPASDEQAQEESRGASSRR